MFILDTNSNNVKKHYIKTMIVYTVVSIFCIIVNKIYKLFGHGVTSNSMTYMFLFPLLGGTLAFLLLGFVILKDHHLEGYRMFYNIYNSGIATLTVASFLKGILEIAGTSSVYISYYNITGVACLILSLFLLIRMHFNKKKAYL